ncbi:hypothetical protein TNCV_552851 [Trichonephila clavipes]|nr:hypothetical protein TNCV_552851 [Trichonephila clavipes]
MWLCVSFNVLALALYTQVWDFSPCSSRWIVMMQKIDSVRVVRLYGILKIPRVIYYLTWVFSSKLDFKDTVCIIRTQLPPLRRKLDVQNELWQLVQRALTKANGDHAPASSATSRIIMSDSSDNMEFSPTKFNQISACEKLRDTVIGISTLHKSIYGMDGRSPAQETILRTCTYRALRP